MPVPAFNPFNPWSYLDIWRRPPAIFPASPRLSDAVPIEIKPRNSDPGCTMSSEAPNSVTIRGRAVGPRIKHDLSGYVEYTVSRGMSFTLDIDKAPTEDVFGRTNFTEKNRRSFTLETSSGWSAAVCAQRLADKVNAGRDFRAVVKTAPDGAATIEFSRR